MESHAVSIGGVIKGKIIILKRFSINAFYCLVNNKIVEWTVTVNTNIIFLYNDSVLDAVIVTTQLALYLLLCSSTCAIY